MMTRDYGKNRLAKSSKTVRACPPISMMGWCTWRRGNSVAVGGGFNQKPKAKEQDKDTDNTATKAPHFGRESCFRPIACALDFGRHCRQSLPAGQALVRTGGK